ncbi:ribbon-helix-helix domain-containing protein [Algiphilus sp. W345]|uniref:Ribbon-helix-helix domain-containing protein n=1 Tax=Banduia mediterranea TaxID=3075609 RepID=A0ABU2WHC9_9GAMM|nr:ribbon-helix-helix domain-containing protein [Algiphilus sp. W345]MCH9828607.1 ribbon-helix-helix domain-containing protein [Gammaproteobacteria bacterium]MDT0497288.1 ribbon-helix-helix domain-containing protein [Algiphilus sp. W345]
MSRDDTTRWTLTVSKDTDIALRSYLAQRGMKKGDLSAFVEEAVRWRVFEQTVADARKGFSDLPADEAQRLIDEAVADTRANLFSSSH